MNTAAKPAIDTELSRLSSETFRPYIGETFLMQPETGSPLSLTLRDVKEFPAARMHSAPPEQRMPFSLSFSGCKDTSVMFGTVSLSHDSAGTLAAVSITQVMPPRGLADPNAWYQVVFN